MREKIRFVTSSMMKRATETVSICKGNIKNYEKGHKAIHRYGKDYEKR